jgi:outer membrane lipoprotein-sorting protein
MGAHIAFVLVLGFGFSVFGAEDAGAKKEVDVAGLVKELRGKAAQWKSGRSQFLFVESSSGDDYRFEGELVWLAPSRAIINLRMDGGNRTEFVMTWDEDTFSEYDLDDLVVERFDLKNLRGKFGAVVLERCGLRMGTDPFQGLVESSLKLLGEENWNGEEAYLFEAKAHLNYEAHQYDIRKVLIWVGAKDGLLRRSEFYGADGKRALMYQFSVLEKRTDEKAASERMASPEGKFQERDRTKEIEEWIRATYGEKKQEKEEK